MRLKSGLHAEVLPPELLLEKPLAMPSTTEVDCGPLRAGLGRDCAARAMPTIAAGIPVSEAPLQQVVNAFKRYVTQAVAGERPECVAAASVLCVLLLGIADVTTPPELTFSIFYLVPVTLSTWLIGRTPGITISVLSALVWFVAEIQTTPNPIILIHIWNVFSRVGVFLSVVFALAKIRDLQAELYEKVNERTAQLRSEVAQRLELENEIAAVSARERQRIGHELHDGLGQYLTGIAFRAKALEECLKSEGVARAVEAKELAGLISEAIHEVRSLARGLDPIEVETTGLIGALEGLAADTQRFFNVNCQFRHEEPIPKLSTGASLTLFRIAQEAVHNAAKHSGADRIEIELALLREGLSLRVGDDGVGFEPAVQHSAGMGLRIMKYRAQELGGQLKMSSGPGAGTMIECLVPRGSAALQAPTGADEKGTPAANTSAG